MEEVTKVLPAVALRGTTILPDMIVHFDISRPKSARPVFGMRVTMEAWVLSSRYVWIRFSK